MRYIISVLTLLFACVLYANNSSEGLADGEEYDYSNVRWGMTMEEVEKALQEKSRKDLRVSKGDRRINAIRDFRGIELLENFRFENENDVLNFISIAIHNYKSEEDFSVLKNAIAERYGRLIPDAKNFLFKDEDFIPSFCDLEYPLDHFGFQNVHTVCMGQHFFNIGITLVAIIPAHRNTPPQKPVVDMHEKL